MNKRFTLLMLCLVGLLLISVACSDKTIITDDLKALQKGTKNPVVGPKGMTFYYIPSPKANPSSVYLMGAFNGWAPDEDEMRLSQLEDGRWSVTVQLDSGRWEYKFVVDGKQSSDPSSKEVESDGIGSFKSYVTVN